ncbi:hypothetical protein AO741_20490 [Pseudomonas sp. TTU2014-105ASC]|nr:hypothetical protein AO741_20490 [Pseudomonas sp. TTU2014-105ASC]
MGGESMFLKDLACTHMRRARPGHMTWVTQSHSMRGAINGNGMLEVLMPATRYAQMASITT